MAPTYQKMTMVPVLRHRGPSASIPEDGVYLIHLNGAVQIKRLQRVPGQRILVKSDNPKYDDYHIHVSEPSSFEVLGSVLA
jgi:phage repressor protein C with HTH and peptisase S24 domain